MGKTTLVPSSRASERKSTSRSPASEKKNPNRTTELDCQLSQIQEELRKAKDELASSELQKKITQLEAEETKKHLTAVRYQLEESKRQVQELCDTEDERIYELRKLGKERDRAWQSELEAVRKRHSVDSAALLSAMNEIQRLKHHYDTAVSSEASQAKRVETAKSELQTLKKEMAEMRTLVENLNAQAEEYEKSEVEYQESINFTHLQLDMARTTIETLQTEAQRLMESHRSVSAELEESKATVRSLEETVAQLHAEKTLNQSSVLAKEESAKDLNVLRYEIDALQSALETAETRYLEEQIRCVVQTLSAQEAIVTLKINFSLKEAEYESFLNELKAETVDLKSKVGERGDELRGLLDLSKRLNAKKEHDEAIASDLERKLQMSMKEILNLRADLMDKENELQNVMEENGLLKSEKENQKKESVTEKTKTMKSEEQGTQVKTEAITQSDAYTIEIAGRHDDVNEDNTSMEAELRRLRIQTEQWKKAAEVAMALIGGGNGGMLERAESFDYSGYRSDGRASPFVGDIDSLKKRKNVLRKIGVLLKKSQK